MRFKILSFSNVVRETNGRISITLTVMEMPAGGPRTDDRTVINLPFSPRDLDSICECRREALWELRRRSPRWRSFPSPAHRLSARPRRRRRDHR
jgi:hypothetical protein